MSLKQMRNGDTEIEPPQTSLEAREGQTPA
jgi:hypothetical protein